MRIFSKKAIILSLMRVFLFILSLTFYAVLFAQEEDEPHFGLRFPQDNSNYKRSECQVKLSRMPKELRYSVGHTEDGMIYFYASDVEWLKTMINDVEDGLTVDLVPRSHFYCQNPTTTNPDHPYKGVLMPPVYKPDMQFKTDDEGNVYVPLGYIPDSLRDIKLEENMMIINDKHVCSYNTFYNIKSHAWQLMNTGMYVDFKQKLPVYAESDQYFSKHTQPQELKVIIPFEKDKSNYNKEDFGELYDSLKLREKHIDSIHVSAYASVEGSRSHNEALVRKRAESILNALQAYQVKSFVSTVDAHENWVEFYTAISGTSLESLAKLPPEEIKKRLKEPETEKKAESLLGKHRKAVVTFYITDEKILSADSSMASPASFEEAINNKEIDRALQVQQAIYAAEQQGLLSPADVEELTIPKHKKYDVLRNNKALMQLDDNLESLNKSIDTFEELSKNDQNNCRVKYNLLSLKLRRWTYGQNLEDKNTLRKSLDALLRCGDVPATLVRRLQMNYNIILTSYYMKSGNYREKDRMLQSLYRASKRVKLRDDDIVSVAKYFSYYRNFKEAERILIPHIHRLDVSEELLFYFLNLALPNEDYTTQTYFNTLLINARQQNPERFCELFNSYYNGGITFQLLENQKLKDFYCDQCDDAQ